MIEEQDHERPIQSFDDAGFERIELWRTRGKLVRPAKRGKWVWNQLEYGVEWVQRYSMEFSGVWRYDLGSWRGLHTRPVTCKKMYQ